MRRIITLYITPLIGILIVVLDIGQVQEYLVKSNKNASLYILIGLVSLVIVNHFLTIYSPLKKYEQLNRQKWYILKLLVENINKEFEKYDLSFNLMIPKRKWFFIEVKNVGGIDKKKLKLCCKVFDFVWRCKNQSVSKKLKISINQGIAGKVYKEGVAIIHNFTNDQDYFGLNADQIDLTKKIKILFSVPVLKEDAKFADKDTDIVLAVLNAESKLHLALDLFNNEQLRKKLSDNLIIMTKVCNKII